MYKEHCLGIIAPAMRDDMATFRRGVMFAVCSIRQPITSVPDQIAALFEGGENPLFGHKFNAWAWISEERNCSLLWKKLGLFWALQDYKGKPTRSATSCALMALLEIPGLGIVKSAFILQLMGFDIACLDSRNVKREGRNPREYETRGTKGGRAKFQVTKINCYLDDVFGEAQEYWDAWCQDVAQAYDRTPEEISELHLAIVANDYVPF